MAISPSFGDGLEIASTCKVVELDQFVDQAPPDWTAAPLFRQCCRSFLASFKIWNEATVGGNICMSLPAGPMISLTAALEGVCTLWPRSGEPRQVPVVDFVDRQPPECPCAWRIVAVDLLCPLTRSAKLSPSGGSRSRTSGARKRCSSARGARKHGEFLLTITAATVRPVPLRFHGVPPAEELKRAIDDAVPFSLYLDDVHGSPAHRKHLTHYFAEQIRSELSA